MARRVTQFITKRSAAVLAKDTRLLAHVEELRTFLEENKGKLKLKPRAGE